LHHIQGFGLSLFDTESPAALDAAERNFWLDLWRSPVIDAVAEDRIESRWYGPLQATVVARLPEEAPLNLLLGADEPGAVDEGHLAEALDWIEGLGVDCRVPIGADEWDEAPAAEELLDRRGYRRTESLVRLVRDSSPLELPVAEGLEVIEVDEFTEGFAEILTKGYGLGGISSMFFSCLPERHDWRCYIVLDERDRSVAAGAMMLQWGAAAHLGFAATVEEARGRGAHRALLDRCIRDAAASCPTVFAETVEPLGERDGPSPGCRNLLRAGFKQASVRTVWRPENVRSNSTFLDFVD
jgi:GNAT superfamily N-acetyltransferase